MTVESPYATIPGGVAGFVFSLLGCYNVLRLLQGMTRKSDLWIVLAAFSDALFLVFFGAAAGCVLLMKRDDLSKYFGFLKTLTGRAIFFIVMSMYVLGCQTSCGNHVNRWNRGKSCWENSNDNFDKFAIVAGWVGLAVGVYFTFLRCNVSETTNINVIGNRRGDKPIYLASAVASFGMCIIGVHWLIQFFRHFQDLTIYVFFAEFSRAFIVLTFGVCSLVGSLFVNPFVAGWFAFLDAGWPCGLFYLLMGFWQFPKFHKEDQGTGLDLVCFICSIIAMVVGGIILVQGGR